MLRKTITSLVGAAMLAVPSGNLWAATHAVTATPKKKAKKRVVTRTVSVLGTVEPCGPKNKWGDLQVRIKVKKTTTYLGKKKKGVKIKIVGIDTPVTPDGTFKTRYIHEQALPLIYDQVLELQSSKIESISGATDTVESFTASLNAAIAKAKK